MTIYTLQALYFGQWEDLTSETTKPEILARRDDYRRNDPTLLTRIRKVQQ